MKNKKMTYCIVVPAYKEHLDTLSRISLRSLQQKTHNYEHVYLITPEGLNISEYLEIFDNIKHTQINPIFFKNLYTYTQLCISYNFYNMFSQYDYMMIYQLDCYMFKDEIQRFVDMGYDYIGAPIFSIHSCWKTVTNKHPAIGNGGLSLRKIEKFKAITDPNGQFRRSFMLSDKVLSTIKIEDMYFCDTIERLYDMRLNKPTLDIALEFSWDQSVEYIDALLKNAKLYKLPMGIHAVNKSLDYWKNKIPEINDETYEKIKEESTAQHS